MDTDPFDRQLADELRRVLGHEFRAEAEAAEDDARKLSLRSRTMGHVAYDLMGKGTHVAIHAGELSFSGPIVHCRGNLAVVEIASGGLVHVHLDGPVVVRTLEARSTGVTWDPMGATSFAASLLDMDIARAEAMVVVPGSVGAVRGRIEAVTPDHLAVASLSGVHHIPLRLIAAVVVSRG